MLTSSWPTSLLALRTYLRYFCTVVLCRLRCPPRHGPMRVIKNYCVPQTHWLSSLWWSKYKREGCPLWPLLYLKHYEFNTSRRAFWPHSWTKLHFNQTVHIEFAIYLLISRCVWNEVMNHVGGGKRLHLPTMLILRTTKKLIPSHIIYKYFVALLIFHTVSFTIKIYTVIDCLVCYIFIIYFFCKLFVHLLVCTRSIVLRMPGLHTYNLISFRMRRLVQFCRF